MIPNSAKYQPGPVYCRELVTRIGLSQRIIAEKIGISERRLRHCLKGDRPTTEKGIIPVNLTYPEQFALECLAEAAEAMRKG